jgi:aspartyl/asparaginyl beta-hydroxylase (cupin superfamily)
VGDQVRHWAEGQSLMFDDTYEHEAWNHTDGERVVLFLDIKRPLRRALDLVNDGIVKAVQRSPMIRNAPAQHVAREPQFRAAWNTVVGRQRSVTRRGSGSRSPHRC